MIARGKRGEASAAPGTAAPSIISLAPSEGERVGVRGPFAPPMLFKAIQTDSNQKRQWVARATQPAQRAVLVLFHLRTERKQRLEPQKTILRDRERWLQHVAPSCAKLRQKSMAGGVVLQKTKHD